EDSFDLFGQRGAKDLDGLPQVGVALPEQLDSFFRQIEFGAARTEAVPAEVAVPFPMHIGAIVLLKGDAAAIRGVAATGNFRIVQHTETSPAEQLNQRTDPVCVWAAAVGFFGALQK